MDPERLGPYRIVKPLGEGGMGTVYQAVHEESGDSVAVKVLLASLSRREGFRARFDAEIESLRKLKHPNIVQLFGFGEDQGVLFYAMEMIQGTPLDQMLEEGKRFGWEETVRMGRQICQALRHAHDRGIIHRDLKPANLMLNEQGNIKLADFGIARLYGVTGLTMEGGIVGTATYMPPEQVNGEKVTERSDLYSLGCVLYALLTGRPPFMAKSLAEMLNKQVNEEAPPVRTRAPWTPVELEVIIKRLLAKKPADRIPNARVLEKSLSMAEQAIRFREAEAHEAAQRNAHKEQTAEALAQSASDKPKDTTKSGEEDPAAAASSIMLFAAELVEDDDDLTLDRDRMMTAIVDELQVSDAASHADMPSVSEANQDYDGTHDLPTADGTAPAATQELPPDAQATFDSNPSAEPEQTADLSIRPDDGGTLSDPAAATLASAAGQDDQDDQIFTAVEADDSGVGQTFFNAQPANQSLSDQQATLERSAPPTSDGQDNTVNTGDLHVERDVGTLRPGELEDTGELDDPIRPEDTSEHTADASGAATEDAPADAAQASTFITVEEADRLESEIKAEEEHDPDHGSTWPLIIAAVVLLGLAVVIVMVLRPPSEDDLYRRSMAAANSGSTSSLLDAEIDIRDFLRLYPDDPRCEELEPLLDEIELVRLERRLRTRSRTTLQNEVDQPIEQSVLEAIRTAQVEPDRGLRKLDALLVLYDADASDVQPSDEVAQYIALAQRQRDKLREQINQMAASHLGIMRQRLAGAERVAETDPAQARDICNAIIELYKDKAWAADTVQRARDLLEQVGEPVPAPANEP